MQRNAAVRIPIDLSIFEKYFKTWDPVIVDNISARVDLESNTTTAVFHIQISSKKMDSAIQGAMPQLDIALSQHHEEQRHNTPHLQVKIHSPALPGTVHLGTYYFIFEVGDVQELERVINGYICLVRDICSKIHQELPVKLFNLELIEEDQLSNHLPILKKKLGGINNIKFKVKNLASIHLDAAKKAIRPDAEGYCTLNKQQFCEILSKSEQKKAMTPLLELLSSP